MVLFEVLSPSTRNYDQTIKLAQYRKIPGLLAYVMIDSEQVWVEQYYRAGENSWQVDAPLEAREAILQIPTLNITIPLSALYESLLFDEEQS